MRHVVVKHGQIRFGSLAAAARPNWDVRFTPESGHGNDPSARPLWDKSGLDLIYDGRALDRNGPPRSDASHFSSSAKQNNENSGSTTG